MGRLMFAPAFVEVVDKFLKEQPYTADFHQQLLAWK